MRSRLTLRRRLLVAAPALVVTTVLLSPTNRTAASPQPARSAGSAPSSAAAPALSVRPAGSRPAKQAVAVGTGGAVASETVGASRAGLSVLKHGGNAIDAAVAMAATLGVDDPFVAGPGGGGFMVIYLAHSHKIVTLDARETCPAGCTPQLFLNQAGAELPFELARHSGISVGDPGLVSQWAKASRLYGRHSFARNLQPAIRLARRGFPVTSDFHNSTIEALSDLRAFSSSRRLFLRNGNALPVGSTFRNPDLAKTYTMLARHGAGYLYHGPLGKDVAATVQHPPVADQAPTGFRSIPGLMTRRDLANYVTKNRRPTYVRYRGLDVYSMAPPSSGGSTVGEALNILSGWPLGSESRADGLYHFIEASRLAFADRNAYVGDRDYVPVPLSGLLSKKFAATRRCLVQGHALQSPVAPGDPFAPYSSPCTSTTTSPTPGQEGTSTNHLVTADRWGNVVSYTNTIEQIAGSGMTVPGRGFLLNNEMTDFDFAPPTPSTYDPNLPAPGKRPRSSMSPAIVLRNGHPWLAVGSPGGSTIITTVLQTLVNRIDFDLTLPQAIAAPRANEDNDGEPTSVEPAFARAPYAKVLRQEYGERFALAPADPSRVIGFVNALEFLKPGVIQAATEATRLGGGSVFVVHPRRR